MSRKSRKSKLGNLDRSLKKMSQRSYNHLALATSRSKSRIESNASTPQTLCTSTTNGRILLSAKDTSEQETHKSTKQFLGQFRGLTNLYLY